MLITLVLVVAVIYRSSTTVRRRSSRRWRCRLPSSGTFAVMKLLDFSLNNLSMMALILSIGFVVDDAIVMLENIVRHIETGESPIEASLNGSREIGFTILTMTMSLAAVFIPILFMTRHPRPPVPRVRDHDHDRDPHLRRLVSITLTPMLCSRFLRVVHTQDGARGAHGPRVEGVLRLHVEPRRGAPPPGRDDGGVAACWRATVHMYGIVPKGFIPDQDNDVRSRHPVGAGDVVPRDVGATRKVADIVRRNPNIESFLVEPGGAATAPARRTGADQIKLAAAPTRPNRRSRSPGSLGGSSELSQLPGVRKHPAVAQIGAVSATARYNVTVQSANTDELYTSARRLSPAMEARSRPIQDVSNDLELKSPKISLAIDRDKAAALGLNAPQIESGLSNGYGSKWSSTIYGEPPNTRCWSRWIRRYQDTPIRWRRSRSRRRAGGWWAPVRVRPKKPSARRV